MGRQKATPQRNNLEQQSLYDYIPVKKRKSRKKNDQIKIYSTTKPTESNQQFYLGQLLIGHTQNIFPAEWSSCNVSFLNIMDTEDKEEFDEKLHLELDGTSVLVSILPKSDLLKDILISKIFAIDISSSEGNVYFKLYFITLPLPKFNKKIGTCLQYLASLFFNILIPQTAEEDNNFDQSSNNAIVELYTNIKKVREEKFNLGNEEMQHPRLKPELRPYQADAVRWMLHREKKADENEDSLHPLYTVIKLQSGLEIYFDKYSGYIETMKPLTEKSSKGGILADEMGLGKTVEVLACILLHPKASNSTITNSDEQNLEKIPSVDIISRKRKFQGKKSESSNVLVDESKKIKIRDDWVKSSSKKSQLRVTLEMWYNNCLKNINVTNKKEIKEEISVQCICGRDDDNGSVICEECGKIQHGNCLGYKHKLGPYRCPQCWMNQPLIECGATLIVSPIALRNQWCKEICKHIKGEFKVLQYGGCSITPIYPTELKKYDVVITTYSVLKSELRLTQNIKERSHRLQQRYSPLGSPLTRVKWWRLCLDEAQMVETTTSMVATMAMKLDAHFRWAVTGTPISKEISDLHGLINYLQIEPYNDKFTWENVLFEPYMRGDREKMHTFLCQVLWRSSKAEVINQINIPKQTIKEHWLDFTAVEQYFYKCEHRFCCEAFLNKIKTYDSTTPLETLDKSSLKNVLGPLLALRQVCTFPNSVRTRYLATKKNVNTMKDLLEALILKNTNESDEFLRVVLSSLNGLAGIYLLMQNPEAAIEQYRKVLQLYTRFTQEEKIAKLTVDKLQIIHTMHNLAEVLEVFPSDHAKTLRDENLRKDCSEIEQKYIGKYITQSMNVLQDCVLISGNVQKMQNSFTLAAGKWYGELLNWIYIYNYNQDLYSKIENAHHTTNVEASLDFRSDRALVYALAKWDEAISEFRENSIDIINDLYIHCPQDEFQIVISQEIVQKATDCHLRPQKKNNKKKCPLCVANDHLKAYELKLFSMGKRTATFEDMSLKGSWKPTTEELVFKSILAVGRLKNANTDWIKDGEIHINLLESIKKEFKEIRRLWTFLDQQICAQDELDICKIRLRLKDPNEEKPSQKKQVLKNLTYNIENKLETIHHLDEHELDFQRASLQREERDNMAALEKNLGIRSYLETLNKQQYEGQSPDPCPICKNALEQQWSILSCGHSYCLDCMQTLITQIKKQHIQCCVCRENHFLTEISYIKQGEQSTPEKVSIKGYYSAKVEGVIKLIQELKDKDSDVKVLVFSTWASVLNYLKDALTNNDISCELLNSSNLEKHIEKFKDEEQHITTLLLPIHLGSKGLNLIEATHIILIEPLLNLGDELQAIGRIHRIGQTKPTVVHKFFIKNTIEESIYNATSRNSQNWEKNKVTLRQLTDLFIDNSEDSITAEN